MSKVLIVLIAILALAAAHTVTSAGTALTQVNATVPAIDIMRNGAQPPAQGPVANFTGPVRIASQFQRSAPARVAGSLVTFDPGARTAWHTHPLGQTLIVTAGSGLVQSWGDPVQQIHEGDVVWIPPGVKHWHGATPAERMSHLAITEGLDGKLVDWLEKVTDEQYRVAGRKSP